MSQRAAAAPRPGGTSPRRSPPWQARATIAAAAALLIAVALVPALRTFDLSPLRGTITAAASRAVGRALTVGRGPTLCLSLVPTLVAENVSLANAPWGSRPEMARARRVEVSLRVLPLLLGRVSARLVLVSPEVLLETDRAGHGNWVFSASASAAASRSSGRPFLSRVHLAGVRITDAAVSWRGAGSGQLTRIGVPTLSLTPRVGAGLTLRALLLTNGVPLDVSGEVGGLDAISGVRPFPFQLKLTAPGLGATLAGSVTRLPALEGLQANLALAASDASVFGGVIGWNLPRLSPFRIAAELRNSGPGWAAAPLHAEVGSAALAGSLTYTPGGPRPRIALALSAPRIDLPSLTREVQQQGLPAHPADRRLFSAAPLPLAFMDEVDGAFDLEAATLVVRPAAEVTSASAHGTLENGRMSFHDVAMRLGGGTLSGRAELDAGRPPVFAADLSGQGIPVESLLRLLGIPMRCSGGATDLAVRLRGTGDSPHQWMASLAGTVRVVVGKGRIERGEFGPGADLLSQIVAAVNPFHKRETTTELRCAVLNVPVERGVVKLDRRLGLETSTLFLLGAGKADLGAETLDVQVHSRARQGLGFGLGSFAGAVRVYGPLARPAVGLNPVSTAESTATTVGAAAVTGGLSIVATRLWERLFTKSPCQTALREGPRTPPPAAEPRKK